MTLIPACSTFDWFEGQPSTLPSDIEIEVARSETNVLALLESSPWLKLLLKFLAGSHSKTFILLQSS